MIEVINLKKEFKGNIVFDNVNLKFEKGNIYGITGKNGSGKSVFFKTLVGLYYPTSGEVLFDKMNYNSNDKFPPSMRALIEKPQFFSDLNAFDNLKVLTNIQHKVGDKEIERVLELVNLENNKKIFSKFSQGMKQKLALAAIFVEETDTIILDEPFNAIEEETVKKICEYINSIKKNKIILISSHHKEDLVDLNVDKIYKFTEGKVIDEK